MNRFAELLDRLAYEPGRNNKLRLLSAYFREVGDPDRGYALAALTGALSFKHAKPGMIRDLIAARTDPVLFALSIGPVFFLVSAQAPLMQRWFSAHPRAGEPWALYAASNLGSFAGLLAYPLLAEPLLGLHAQAWSWSLGYAVLVALIGACGWARPPGRT